MLESGIILSLLAANSWGVNAFFLRKAVEKADLLLVVFLNTLMSALSVTAILSFAERAVYFSLIDGTAFSIAGIINFSIFAIGYTYGIKKIGVSRATPISSSNIILTTIFAVVLLGEKITVGIIIGVCLLFLGVTLLGVRKLSESLQFSRESIYVLLVTVALSLYPVVIRMSLRRATYTFLQGLFLALWAGAATNLTFVLILGKLKTIGMLNKNAIYYVIGVSLSSMSANLCYYAALSSMPVVIVNSLTSFYPFISIGLSHLFTKEEITSQAIGGAVLIFLGVCSVIFIS